jgi:hypothetical protein
MHALRVSLYILAWELALRWPRTAGTKTSRADEAFLKEALETTAEEARERAGVSDGGPRRALPRS